MLNKCETIRHLQEAKQEIEKGWCQGTLEHRNGSVCALGAHVRVARRRNLSYRHLEYREIRQFLHDALPPGYEAIPHYNDTPGRKKEEIMALFDRAAELACRTLED